MSRSTIAADCRGGAQVRRPSTVPPSMDPYRRIQFDIDKESPSDGSCFVPRGTPKRTIAGRWTVPAGRSPSFMSSVAPLLVADRPIALGGGDAELRKPSGAGRLAKKKKNPKNPVEAELRGAGELETRRKDG